MERVKLDGKRINQILNEVLKTIEGSKEEIFAITEKVRGEFEKTKGELEILKKKSKEIIRQVDFLEREEKISRQKLLIVSRDFNSYSEQAIKDAYEKANNLRIALILKREEEKALTDKRKNLELRLKDAIEVLDRAEKLTTQISVAMSYLSGNLNTIIDTIEDMSKKQFFGIKIIEAQEEERQRVARDIHDGPAQSFANLNLKVEICEKLLSIDINRAKAELKNLKQLVRDNLKDVRKIIYDLRPMSLDDLGLIPTVERYVSVFSEETSIQSDVKIFNASSNIDSIVEIAAFRIIQEALSNIRKHSKAKNALIKIECNRKMLYIVINDDGIGFDTKEIYKNTDSLSGGFGVIGMKERAELLGGNLQITSVIGKGTKVILTIPINRKDDTIE